MKTFISAKCFRRSIAGLVKNFALFSVSLLLAGCPAGKPAADASAPDQPVAPAGGEKVVIRGSNTIGEELAPRLIAEFKKAHPAVVFDLETKATGYGLAAVRAGQCDIAAASRPAIKEELDLTAAWGIELNDHVLGAYSVAVVINASNPIANLTKDQVRGIFTGRLQNWKDVGGSDVPIHLYIRDPISGTYLGFKDIAMSNEPYADHPTLHTNYATLVQAVAGDATGIGYSGLDLAKTSGVKAVAIEDVEACPPAVNSGRYPYARVLRFYTNKAKESPPTKEFIQFVLSPRGQEIVAQLGFTPKP